MVITSLGGGFFCVTSAAFGLALTVDRDSGGLAARSRTGDVGSSYAAVALRSKDQSATGSRLASQATAKLFAKAHGKTD
jgi:hypothetical protein